MRARIRMSLPARAAESAICMPGFWRPRIYAPGSHYPLMYTAKNDIIPLAADGLWPLPAFPLPQRILAAVALVALDLGDAAHPAQATHYLLAPGSWLHIQCQQNRRLIAILMRDGDTPVDV